MIGGEKCVFSIFVIFFFQAEDGIRGRDVTEFRRVLFRSVLLNHYLSTTDQQIA